MDEEISVFTAQSIRGIIWFYQRLGKSISETKQDLDRVYGEKAPSMNTVRLWWYRAEEGCTQVSDRPRPGRPTIPGSAELVSRLLEEQPFASLRSMSMELGLSKSTIENVVKSELGMRHFDLRWVPHTLSAAQKAKRVDVSAGLLAILDRMSRTGLAYLLTSDESWFMHHNPHSARWATSATEAGQRVRQTLTKEKCLVVMTWSFNGFCHVMVVPQGETYTSDYVVNTLLPALDETLRAKRPVIGISGTKLHWDNARPHTSHETQNAFRARGVTILPHAPYSPDLAPCDFFVFGYIKRVIKGRHFSCSEEIISAIYEIFSEIPSETLLAVLEQWKNRLRWVIANNGEYYTP